MKNRDQCRVSESRSLKRVVLRQAQSRQASGAPMLACLPQLLRRIARACRSCPRSKPSRGRKFPSPSCTSFKPQQPKRIELKNGIVLFLQEDHELPFISGSVLIPGGSRDEDPAKAGLVGLYGQAWRTSGTAKMDGDAMDDLLEAKAAHIETAGDEDSTAISWDSLKGDADQVFSLAMDLLFHPKFSAEKLQLAQQQEATGHRAPQRRRRRNCRARSGQAGLRREQPLYAPAGAGHHRRGHAGRS